MVRNLVLLIERLLRQFGGFRLDPSEYTAMASAQ